MIHQLSCLRVVYGGVGRNTYRKKDGLRAAWLCVLTIFFFCSLVLPSSKFAPLFFTFENPDDRVMKRLRILKFTTKANFIRYVDL
ncbi:hypothetical protein BO82DRAFT_124894 [Aspergillus uvarum CBS 121591]|uniref:Uncharacterized protein n=1 Tax=Aspergillus uvarum CBS 121591 TaxID=1448315 RepID=A0A319C1H3_9EURO|nr:hypothetical protein BO82DRAFT_124894 [Aspergillus uvarum CBS 121591]PYH79866.1 hypothetical protein BO82DRAFT_124894 [Aspergillus uvarum CBS 121591]